MEFWSHRKRQHRRPVVRTVVAAVAFGTLLASGAPALAAPAAPDPDGATVQRGGPGGRPGSTGSTEGLAGAFRAARTPGKSGAAGDRAIPDPDVEAPGCNAYVLAWSDPHQETLTQPGVAPEPVTIADLGAWGEVECTAGLLSLYARTDLVDRQYNFVLNAGLPVVRNNYGSGGIDASTAATRVIGEHRDYGRVVEGTLDLTMRLRAPWVWLSCSPPPGNRMLLCAGLNTSTLHVILGTSPFSSGLPAPAIHYVALGDSYASGTNAGVYDSDFPACRRSLHAYSRPFLGFYLNGKPLRPTTLRACHGARIGDVTGTQSGSNGPQIEAVYPDSTRLVTIQMGGNDLGFGSTLFDCVFETGDCVAPSPELLAVTQARLTALYQQILTRLRRPDATLVVLTYPRILPATRPAGCGELAPFTQPELDRVNAAWSAAHEMIVRAVAAVPDPRIRLVDVYNDFEGHLACAAPTGGDICGTAAWASGFISTTHSFHPNRGGHCAVARRLMLSLNFTLTP
jgi:lysophospholipase L1-like esterase